MLRMGLRNKKNVPAPAEGRKTAAKRKKREPDGSVLGAVSAALAVAAAVILIASFFFQVLMISGDSMEPGLNDGDILLLVKTQDLAPGDLISFRWNGRSLLKRVVARPGDWVMMDADGRVYVNGAMLIEPYVAEFSSGTTDVEYPYQVPEDSYFVMGDERASSLDSRSSQVGCVGYDQIIGKGIIRLWPLRKGNAG